MTVTVYTNKPSIEVSIKSSIESSIESSNESSLYSTIEAAQQGDKEAIATLCKDYEPLIRKYASARPIVCESKDMESELWIIFLKALKEYNLNGSVPFSGFIKSRIRYGQYNVFRKWRHRWQSEVPGLNMGGTKSTNTSSENQLNLEDIISPAPAAESTYLDRYDRELLKQAFSKLQPMQHQLLHAYYFENQSLVDIGKRFNITRQAVHKHKNRALTALYMYMTGKGM